MGAGNTSCPVGSVSKLKSAMIDAGMTVVVTGSAIGRGWGGTMARGAAETGKARPSELWGSRAH